MLEDGQGPEAIMLEFKEPVWIVERLSLVT